ncbi:uncharacterized protein LOC121276489 isoform X2 [Carcharodon carcharias]|uniref:uncharacterized protein LOC121276489 isoform X2 n=1 Tax=Carcharodon carcharias TaxID=13397 RepID=UPI001B7E7734|nr:uncharacterized protein LOC121276489 isoform X2 [Carcharodon carcharias]
MEPSLSASRILQKWTGILVCVSAFAAHANPQPLNSGCADHYDKVKNCCNECQAGFYLSAPCNKDRPVNCKPCGEGEFLEHSNSQTECLKQIECDEMKGFEILHRGDAVTATQCVCRANYHCSQDCEYCLRDNPCLPGFEVKEKANRLSDTKCRPCPPTYFSNETSLTAKCKLRTNCTILGMKERVPGNMTSDAVCISVDASLSPISDCVRQRIADAWCSVRSQKRNEGNPPADQAIGKLPSDNHDWDRESELFIPPKYPEKAIDQASGSIFYTFAEHPDCSYALKPFCEVEPLHSAAHSPRIPRENPESKYSIGNGGEVSSAKHLEDLRAGNSMNPLLPAAYKVEESIHHNSSKQERNNIKSVQTQTCCSTPISGRTAPLPYRQSNKGHTLKYDGHTSHQSNCRSNCQRSDNTDRDSPNNTDSDHSNPGDENSHKSGNSTPSAFSCGTNMTSGQPVLSVGGGSVVFNVIVKVNHTTEQDSRGEVNDRAGFPGRKGTPRENDRFPLREEKPGAECDFETDAGFPVQEQHFKETVCVPVQEEQSRLHLHKVNLPIQEQNSSKSLEESLSLSSKTVRQESQEHPKGSTLIPVQEDGKPEHFPSKEEN